MMQGRTIPNAGLDRLALAVKELDKAHWIARHESKEVGVCSMFVIHTYGFNVKGARVDGYSVSPWPKNETCGNLTKVTVAKYNRGIEVAL